MEILVDASLCSKSGGVQVALAFINQISADSNFEIICVVSPQLNEQINTNVKKRIKHYYIENIEPIYKKFSQGKRISLIEKKHNPAFKIESLDKAFIIDLKRLLKNVTG